MKSIRSLLLLPFLLFSVPAGAGIIFYSGFETGAINKNNNSSQDDSWDWSSKSCEGIDGKDYPIEVVQQGELGSPAPRGGNYMVRFETRDGDRCASGGYRNTIYNHTFLKTCQERWIGYSVFIPNDWKNNIGDCGSIAGGGTEGQRDGLSQYNHSARMGLRAVDPSCSWNPPEEILEAASRWNRPMADYTGRWIDYIVHVDTSTTDCGDNGFLEFWADGEKWGNKNGTIHSGESKDAPANLTMDYKFGLYASPLSDNSPRIVWIDEIRVGDANSSYAEVDPAQGSAPPEPPPEPPPPTVYPCDDGLDNDADGEIDYPEDDGCTSATDDDETDPASSGVTYSAPITISSGGTYVGNWRSTSVGVPAVTINTASPVVIENSNIRFNDIGISSDVTNADVTIRNNSFYLDYRNEQGFAHADTINIKRQKNVVITNNYFHNASSSDIKGCVNASSPDKVYFNNNVGINLNRAESDGNGGYIDESDPNYSTGTNYGIDIGPWFQLNNCNAPDVQVNWNLMMNEPGKSAHLDVFNFFDAGGTSSNRASVRNNFMDGLFSWNNKVFHKNNGMLFQMDTSGSQPGGVTQYIDVMDNYALRGQEGLGAISGGNNVAMEGNVFIRAAYNYDGTKQLAGDSVGGYVWDYKNDPDWNNSGQFWRNNVIGYQRWENGSLVSAHTWFPDCASGNCDPNTVLSGILHPGQQNAYYGDLITKIRANSVVLGPPSSWDAQVPQAPQNLVYESPRFTWTCQLPNEGEGFGQKILAYTVYWDTSSHASDGAYANKAYVPGNRRFAHEYELQFPSSGDYYVVVQAHNAAGDSPLSNEIHTGGTPAIYQCGDGLDNDADGLVDYPEDPGCSSSTDDNETDESPPPSEVQHLYVPEEGLILHLHQQ